MVVVLGAPNDDDGTLSSMARERLDRTLVELQRRPGAVVLPTGGSGEHFNRTDVAHAEYAKRYLVARGVDEGRFVGPALSTDTSEDAALSAAIVAELGADEVIVVTSDFHVERARVLFERALPDVTLTVLGVPHDAPPRRRAELDAHEREALRRL